MACSCNNHGTCKISHEEKEDVAFPILIISISVALLIIDFFKLLPFGGLSWIVVAICGLPIIYGSVKDSIEFRKINTETLVSIGIIAACLINEPFAAGEIAVIMSAGELIEEYATSRTRDGISSLISLNPKTANRITSKGEETVETDSLNIGDVVRIRTGDMIMADGKIVEGNGETDASMITGESLPIKVSIGDKVSSGSINTFGSFDFVVEKKPEDSTMMNIVRLLKSAENDRIPIIEKMEKVSQVMIVTALLCAIGAAVFTQNYIMAVTVLVVFCPCSLLLATPTAITAAIGTASSAGVLIKNGETVERLAKVSSVVFDKTGTLTEGTLKISNINIYGTKTEDELLKITARTELRSQHPLAKSIVNEYMEKFEDSIEEPDSFEMIEGIGVKATFDGNEYHVGNVDLMKSIGSEIPEITSAKTTIFVAENNVVLGSIELDDIIRKGSVHAISKLRKMGIKTKILSGDRKEVTENVSKIVGTDEFIGECKPEDKLNELRKLGKDGEKVCMVGDGINDSPAMKSAFVSIGMGIRGSDVVIESADAVIMSGGTVRVPQTIEFCRKTSRKINVNIAISIILNFVALGLSFMNVLDPVTGALVHNIGAILVVLNSLTLAFYWNRNKGADKMKEYRKEHSCGCSDCSN